MKAKVLRKTKGMSEAEWLTHRKKGIGGSDIAKIVGLSPFGNALSVYASKVGQADPVEDNEAMYWGRVLEDVVAQEFSRRNDLKVRRVNAVLQHPEHDWMLANIDRLIVSPEGVLECKSPGYWGGKHWSGEDGEIKVPDEYLLQVQWYLGVTGLPYGYAAALIGGQNYVDVRVERDDELIAQLIEMGEQFWRMVEAREIPALDGEGRLFGVRPVFDPPRVILPDEMAPRVAQYQTLKDRIKPLEKEADALKDELHQILSLADPEGEYFLCGGYQLNRKRVTTKRLDQKAITAEHPEITEKFMKESEQVRLTVKLNKGENQ